MWKMMSDAPWVWGNRLNAICYWAHKADTTIGPVAFTTILLQASISLQMTTKEEQRQSPPGGSAKPQTACPYTVWRCVPYVVFVTHSDVVYCIQPSTAVGKLYCVVLILFEISVFVGPHGPLPPHRHVFFFFFFLLLLIHVYIETKATQQQTVARSSYAAIIWYCALINVTTNTIRLKFLVS
jgi:hypothetical protein